MKLLIYGCGRNCKRFIENHYISIDDVIGFIDQADMSSFYQKQVFRVDEAKDLAKICDYILITVKDHEANEKIYHDMITCGYPMEKALFIYNRWVEFNEHKIHEQEDMLLRNISMQIYESEVCVRNALIQSTACLVDPMDNKKLIGTNKLPYDEIYLKDYCGYRASELVASEIEANDLTGNCAEAGSICIFDKR